MPRSTRANSGTQESTPEVPAARPRIKRAPRAVASEWTQDQARDLLHQGYSREQVAARTGFPLSWVKSQPIPQQSLLDIALGKKPPLPPES